MNVTRFCKVIILALGFIILSGVGAIAEGGKKWAVVVGVNDYKRPSVTDLKYAVPDAELFARALTEVGGFAPENVFLYTTDNQEAEKRPRLTNLVYRLEQLKDNVSPEDSIFFYFAGHGVEMKGETFLMTENADSRSNATLTMSALRADLLLKLLEECQAKDTLIILDACRNDPNAGRGSADNPMSDAMSRGLVFEKVNPEASQERSLATMLACGVGERSYEWPEKKHGYFTYHLVEGLKSAAADNSGVVHLGGLARYVREKVRDDSGRAGHQQQPILRYEGPGPESWVLARASGGKPQAISAPTPEELLRENKALREENARLRQQLKELQGSR